MLTSGLKARDAIRFASKRQQDHSAARIILGKEPQHPRGREALSWIFLARATARARWRAVENRPNERGTQPRLAAPALTAKPYRGEKPPKFNDLYSADFSRIHG